MSYIEYNAKKDASDESVYLSASPIHKPQSCN